jgi:CHAT domain-containing protein
MQPTHNSKIKTIAIALILLFSIVKSENQSQIYKSYYDRLAYQISQPDSIQISFLKSFIIEHPNFDPPYLRLAERAHLQKNSNDVQQFLTQLTTNPLHGGPANWALASYYDKKGVTDSSFIAFQRALNPAISSLKFYDKFIHFDKMNDYRFSALSLILNSNAAASAKYFAKAIQFYHKGSFTKCAEILSGIDNALNDKNIQYYIANCEITLANLKSAKIAANKAAELSQSVGDQELTSILHNTQFSILWRLDEKTKARQALALADSIARRIDDSSLQNRIRMSKNFLYGIDKNYKMAATGYLETARTFETDRDYQRAARAYYQSSEANYTISRYSLALDSALKSLLLFEKVDDHIETISVLRTISKIYGQLGHEKIGMSYLDRGIALAQKYKYENQKIEMQIKHSKLEAKMSPPRQAIRLIQELVQRYQGEKYNLNQDYCHCICAYNYALLHEYESAEQQYREAFNFAKAAGNFYIQSWALSGIIEMQRKQGISLSPKSFRELVASSKKVADPRLLSFAFISFGDYYKENKEHENAIKYYLKAMHISESMRDSLRAEEFRIGHMASHLTSYKRLSEIYADLNKQDQQAEYIANVFKYEEMHRARSLKENLRPESRNNTDMLETNSDYKRAFEKIQIQQRELRKLKDNSFDENKIDSLLTMLIAGKYKFMTEKIQARHLARPSQKMLPYTPIVLAQLQSQLHQQTILIYHLAEVDNYILAINSDSTLIVYLQADAQTIKSGVDSLLSAMHNVNEKNIATTPFYAGIAHRLYKQIFEPVEFQFPLKNEIYILPQSDIAALPFEMLLTQCPSRAMYTPEDLPDYADSFLVNNYTFYYGPNSVEFIKSSSSPSHPRMLIMANPFENETATSNDFTMRFRTGWRFDPLPYAKMEALKIKKVLPGAKVRMGAKVTETALVRNADNFDIIHIATHAFTDTLFEDFSGLALAIDKDSTDDGLLQGFEIKGKDFSCDLIALSACETGRGKAISGEGILALPRHFLLAGARSVLMSQWKVDDRFTSILLPKFYQHYIPTTMNKANALRHAKVEILTHAKKYRGAYYQHPFFWASFNLYGDPGMEHQPHKTTSLWIVMLGFAGVGTFGFAIFFSIRKKRQGES